MTLLNFKTYYKATVFKRVWYWWKKKEIYQWNNKQPRKIYTKNKVN